MLSFPQDILLSKSMSLSLPWDWKCQVWCSSLLLTCHVMWSKWRSSRLKVSTSRRLAMKKLSIKIESLFLETIGNEKAVYLETKWLIWSSSMLLSWDGGASEDNQNWKSLPRDDWLSCRWFVNKLYLEVLLGWKLETHSWGSIQWSDQGACKISTKDLHDYERCTSTVCWSSLKNPWEVGKAVKGGKLVEISEYPFGTGTEHWSTDLSVVLRLNLGWICKPVLMICKILGQKHLHTHYIPPSSLSGTFQNVNWEWIGLEPEYLAHWNCRFEECPLEGT